MEQFNDFLGRVNWPSIVYAFFVVLVGAFGYFVRGYINARYERQLERLRSELRQREEGFKNDIDSNRRSLSAIEDNLFSGQSARVNTLHSKRCDAAETVWDEMRRLAKMKGAASFIALTKWDVLAEEADKHPPIRDQLFMGLEGVSREDILRELERFYSVIHSKRLYLSQNAWILCSAYAGVLRYVMMFLGMFREGLPAENMKRLFSDETAPKTLLQAALPHRIDAVARCDRERLYIFLDEIEIVLLCDLRQTLDGKQADDLQIEKARIVKDAVAQMDNFGPVGKISALEPGLRSATASPANDPY